MSIEDNLKAGIKNIIPWKARYCMKLFEAKGHKIPFKYHNDYKSYTNAFYGMLKGAGIDDLYGKMICELGVGEYFSHALLAYQMGSACEYMLEIEDYAGINSQVKLKEPFLLSNNYEKKRELPTVAPDETWNSYLTRLNAFYLTNGIEGYKVIPDNTIDYCFSDAVFEHIRKPVFFDTITEIYRFMRKGGISYHIIDFRDHLGGGKNHLRFSEKEWEDDLHYNMDNYVNRYTCSEIVDMLKQVGFSNIQIKKEYYDHIPIKRSQLAKDFCTISQQDLMIKIAKIKMIK